MSVAKAVGINQHRFGKAFNSSLQVSQEILHADEPFLRWQFVLESNTRKLKVNHNKVIEIARVILIRNHLADFMLSFDDLLAGKVLVEQKVSQIG